MEKRRQYFMQNKAAWGDPTPGYTTKSGTTQLPLETLDHCKANYTAATTRFDTPPTMITDAPHPPAPTTDHESFSMQDWSLDTLTSRCTKSNFKLVRRVSALSDKALKAQEIERFDSEGIPIIIKDWHKRPDWPKEFNLDWFKANCPATISVRNVIDGSDREMPTSAFIDKCRTTAPVGPDTERLYGKDLECPDHWRDLLDTFGIPQRLLPGKATDLLSNQPTKVRVKTLMCYLGIGNTFTPCHKDLCASSGQNLMCFTENGGSSFWFMTATKDIFVATEYFHSIKQELDHERHIITIEQLLKAPFDVYIAEQKLGDLVLVPSRSCHQVVNRGGITIKTSWSRMTLAGLTAAYYHELPIYQRVCREETYRIKFTVYCAINNFIRRLNAKAGGEMQRRPNSRSVTGFSGPRTLQRKHALNLKRLLEMYDDILRDERPHPKFTGKLDYVGTPPESPPFSSDIDQNMDEYRITCDFCSADIFQSFFECRHCIDQNDTIDPGAGCVLCPRCYVDGRTCKCGEMIAMQCRQFKMLEGVRKAAAEVLEKFSAHPTGGGISVKSKLTKLGVFAAACLRNQPSDFAATRKCNLQGHSHDVQKYNSLYCSGCHKTTCFQHLLAKYETHAVDALLDSASPDQQSYHKRYHSSNRESICDRDIKEFAERVKHGTAPNMRFQRYHITISFTKCLPGSQHVQRGYYDDCWGQCAQRMLAINQARFRKKLQRRPQLPPPPLTVGQERTSPDSAMSALTELPSDYEEPSAEVLPTENQKRKRYVIKYIDIPPLPALTEYKLLHDLCSSKIQSESTPMAGMRKLFHDALKTEVPYFISASPQDQAVIRATDGPNLMTVEQSEQGQDGTDLACSMDVCTDGGTRMIEGLKDAQINQYTEQHPQEGRAEEHESVPRGANLGSGNFGGRSEDQGRRKNDRAAKKVSSRMRGIDSNDRIDKSKQIRDKSRRQLITKGSIEPQFSGDDSDTAVASRTSQFPEFDGQGSSPQVAPRSLAENANWGRAPAPQHKPDLRRREAAVGGGMQTPTSPLDLPNGLPATNDDEDSPHPSKRRKLDKVSTTRRPRRVNNGSDDGIAGVHASSEPDCARQLVAALNGAWSANHNTSPRSANSVKRLVHSRERPSQQDSQQTHLTVEDHKMYQTQIRELQDRVAVLEKNQERCSQDTLNRVILLSTIKDVMPPTASQPQPLYCVPIPMGQPEGGLFAQNDGYAHRGNYGGNQHFGRQYPYYHNGPRIDYRSRYQPAHRTYGQNARHHIWRGRPAQRTTGAPYREKYYSNRFQVHDESEIQAVSTEVSRYVRRTSPVAGPSRHSGQTIGREEIARGNYNQEASGTSSSPPSGGSPTPLRPREAHAPGESGLHGHQPDPEQVAARWNFSGGWVTPPANNEEPDSQWEDDYVQEDDGARNTDTSHEGYSTKSSYMIGGTLGESSINPWAS